MVKIRIFTVLGDQWDCSGRPVGLVWETSKRGYGNFCISVYSFL